MSSAGGAASRFIPTCVGNMLQAWKCLLIWPVHPHVCGEHQVISGIFDSKFGSSPRVWGTSDVTSYNDRAIRFIPTCVGNIGAGLSRLSVVPVHPHVCGEHSPSSRSKNKRRGSSPRVWGTFFNLRDAFFVARFIPTCVGNMLIVAVVPVVIPVHPHVCGEHGSMRFSSARMCGSSPRVWGTYCSNLRIHVILRFIPTCVGNISPRPRR